MSGKYRTIVADPPWPITKRMGAGGRRARATEVPYEMVDDAIKAMPIAEMADDQAHLYLWTTRALFREGVAAGVARAWGFEPVSEIIWGLRNSGMGGFNGNGHEPVLLASRGDLPWPKNALPQGVEFWRQLYLHGKVHSAKPEASDLSFTSLVCFPWLSPVSSQACFSRLQQGVGETRPFRFPRGHKMGTSGWGSGGLVLSYSPAAPASTGTTGATSPSAQRSYRTLREPTPQPRERKRASKQEPFFRGEERDG